jgi:alpha-D-ribose 1-methylphosphonate 5-triphosphate synthase subunit PhnH
MSLAQTGAHGADLTAGFADPVTDAQRCFRAVLDAMARPGQVHRIGRLDAPPPLGSALAAVLLTLVDQETPLWIDPLFAPARPWIAFHCGAPLVEEPARASFALVADDTALALFCPGTHEAPETAATILLAVAALGEGPSWRLSGPGLRRPALLRVAGLGERFAEAWARNHGLFPCGIDLLLCADDMLAALPRSVTVEEG